MTSQATIMSALQDSNAIWQPIDQIGDLVRGSGLQKKDFVDEGVPAIHYGQIYTYYGLSTMETKSFVSPELAKTLKKVDKGDVVITNTSENIEDVGKALVYLGDEQAVTGGHATVFKPSKNIIGKYLAYYTQTRAFDEYKRKFAKGAKVIDVSATDLARIPVPIPYPDNLEKSLAIQAEIVRILDAFSAIITGLTAEVEARKEQYDYYRDKLLAFDHDDVEWTKLSTLAEVFDGTHQTPAYREEGVPFVSVENIDDLKQTKKFISDADFQKFKYKPRKGDLFMTRIGDIGTCAMVENDNPLAYYVTLALIRVNTKLLDSNYLRFFIESKDGRSELYKRTLTKAVPIKINLGDIGNISVPIPYPNDPDKSLAAQGRIAAILGKFDKLTNSRQEGLPREIELRQKQYAYYRDLLFDFPRREELAA